MFFVLSKVLWVAAAPTNLLLGLALVGTLATRAGARGGRRLAFGTVAALVVCGVLPVGRLMLRPLEDRFPQATLDGPAPAGIVVLGGPIDQEIGAARGQVTVADAATRLTAGAALSRRFPGAILVYTGGSNSLLSTTGGEAADAKRLWVDLGVDADRVKIEEASRNTAENALLTRDLVHPQPGQRWILVTSAYHMPRSVGLFRAAGFDVLPYPVDYRSTGTARDFAPTAEISVGLRRLDVAVREWVGLLAYWASGRIAEPVPGP